MGSSRPSIHEIDFCAQVAEAVNRAISSRPRAYQFSKARIEGYGTGPARRKRKDLRFYDQASKMVLCGEVKLPGTLEGSSPYNAELCADAERKASNAGVQFFFTWNVNTFVLWDRSLWYRPLLDRRVWQKQLSRTMASPQEVAREENLSLITGQFIPDLLSNLNDIVFDIRPDWSMPPDDIFIRSLESHLDWPVQLMSAYVLKEADRSKAFGQRVEQWLSEQERTFVRTPHEEWAKAVDNMAKTLAYVWTNRLIFYQALRARFSDLPHLRLRGSVEKADEVVTALNRLLMRAVERSGDYEPLLMPEATDWATTLVFQPDGAVDAWRGLLRHLESVDFSEVSSDIVGRIFQRLIGPDERHRYGQHFTGDDVVDLINSFCVHSADDAVLDPACGSGSFLVRAYYRKRNMDTSRSHLDLLSELFGCDIALYPAHLATLNLAAREISDEANYPRIARRNFFDVSPQKAFCSIPDDAGGQTPIELPPLSAVVGNPPYVRQEKIQARDKVRFGEIANEAWRDLQLSGRSDLHCYFWPAATRLLKPDGYFGFLTSSSWLDVEYGFAIQGWLLRHFRIVAVMESAAEPWFEDARVKTCVTVIRRCDDESVRMKNPVRFVRFAKRLADIIGVPPGKDEAARQAALEKLRDCILGTEDDFDYGDYRVIVRTQDALWKDGVRAGAILGKGDVTEPADDAEDSEESEDESGAAIGGTASAIFGQEHDEYHAGKWGRYVRAPDFYFEIMRRFGNRFAPLGGIASIRRGITSGCDAFFMPTDITASVLGEHQTDRDFRRHAGGAPRKDVESGKLRIVKAGDGSIHPIEIKYVAPEVHSLMKVDRPVVRAADLDRVVLLVDAPMKELRATAPWTYRYLRYGTTATFRSGKSKPVPVPKRSTCAARDPWYDLTRLVRPGIAFWPKAQHYRHIIPGNPGHIICNCNLYDVEAGDVSERERETLLAVLNSTLVGLFKTFYGRFAGTEGNLKTEVVDVNLLEVPDPRGVTARTTQQLTRALKSLGKRKVGRLVEEQLMECHSSGRARGIAEGPLVLSDELRQPDRRALDDAVFDLLGVSDPGERSQLIDRLYEATAQHFRDIRVVEIEKMEQRSRSGRPRFNVHDLAADIWDAAGLDDTTPLTEWLAEQPESDQFVLIPDDSPAVVKDSPLFGQNAVYFGKAGKTQLECASRAQAELVARLANLGIKGKARTAVNPEKSQDLLQRLNSRIDTARSRFKELAASRTGDQRIQAQMEELLMSWFVLGHEQAEQPRTKPHRSRSERG